MSYSYQSRVTAPHLIPTQRYVAFAVLFRRAGTPVDAVIYICFPPPADGEAVLMSDLSKFYQEHQQRRGLRERRKLEEARNLKNPYHPIFLRNNIYSVSVEALVIIHHHLLTLVV